MTNRDRLVLIGVITFALLGAVWLLVVSPERQQAAKLGTQVSAASAQLAAAESQVADARGAQARYSSAYAAIVSLGKAVPAGQEVPSLMYELAQASNQKDVEFSSIVSGSGTAPTASASASATPAATAGFTQMPFTFTFTGSFADLQRLFQQLNRFTVRTASGGLRVSGRLLTIQSAKLTPLSTEAGAKGASTKLTGTITATAYVLPASQGLTGGATAASPAAATSVPAATSTPASAASTPAAPATIVSPR
jgi:Tfp pilus assembly protein PilO